MGSKLARFSWLPGGLAAALVVALGSFIAPAPFHALEHAVYDRAQRASDVPAKDMVLIDIDAASLNELGPWPWSYAVHARLLRQLHDHQARVVAFAVPFGVPTGQPADDEGKLAAAIAAHGNVVLPVELQAGSDAGEAAALPSHLMLTAPPAIDVAAAAAHSVHPPLPVFAAGASALGHLYLPRDDDGVVRSDLTAMRAGSALIPSLATAITARVSSIKPGELVYPTPTELHIADRRVPLDGSLAARPRYLKESAAGLARYSYSQVLTGAVPAAALRDKIVLIGMSGTRDALATPASRATSVAAITASTVNALLQGSLIRHTASAKVVTWLIMFGVIAFAALVLPAAGPGLGALATVLLGAICTVTDIGLLGSMNTWVPLMLACVAALAGYLVYALSELIYRANARSGAGKDPTADLRNLGQTLQKQGQLDLALETFRRCPLDAATMELLYYLGMDFERRRQNQKAATVYNYIATRDPNYRDLRARRARLKDDPAMRDTAPSPASPRPKATPPAPPPPRNEPRRAERASQGASTSTPSSGGHKLGRYEIERELGKGAMGTVYLGRDPHINRVVAIKAIPLAHEFEEEDFEEARARFFREAEMAGRLNHPAIVTVYDAGEDQGLAYIAMEYLRGQHLSHYTDSERLLPPAKVLTLVARTAEALHYAHRQNLVHRDIKPANIMFDAETDELKITDFGIARLTDTSRTKTGIVLGTPSFMSPEQLEGRNLDGRSDQFSLAVSLYQLLCGQLPFRAESMPRLMHKIATEAHSPIRLVRPELPARIEAVLDRALAKSADDRYVTCAELAAELRACAELLQPTRPASQHEWLTP